MEMGAAVNENTVHSVREPQRSVLEARSNKIVKKLRDKKQLKGLQIDAVVEAVEDNSTESDSLSDNKDKKPQGIVIDGKTYTCATCKTGHRVGVCKHARERPMTATHPPGRPQAGAPKKIVCDCPKQCSCQKKGCKCARQCSCTQTMFMLVYVPAPGEEEIPEDEKGTWKLGEQVTTDLKGNILTLKQIEERRELKEALKSQPRDGKVGRGTPETLAESRANISPGAELKPAAGGGCCTHKESVSARRIATEASPQTGRITKSGACNCGHLCTCAFCPEHPNNNASRSMALQAMHYAGNVYPHDLHSITPFMPMVPPGASCMGGAPQFAISHSNTMPSQFDLQQTFPNRGFVIGYPFQLRSPDENTLTGIPFQTQSPYRPDMTTLNNSLLHGIQTPFPTPQSEISALNYSLDDVNIVGNAFVASAGTGEWNNELMTANDWSLDTTGSHSTLNGFMRTPSFSRQSVSCSEASVTPMLNEGLEFENNLNVHHETPFFDFVSHTQEQANTDANPYMSCQKPCCSAIGKSRPVSEYHKHAETYFTPAGDDYPPVVNTPYG